MFFTAGVTRTPITLLGGGGVGEGKVVIDRVAVEGSDVASVDGIDDGSVVGCVGEPVGPVLLLAGVSVGGGKQTLVVGAAHGKLLA